MIEYVVACALVALGMMLAFGLVRMAANLVIFAILLFGFGIVIRNIHQGAWVGWADIILGSVATGFVSALLSLPALPFSSFYKRK
jgi:hypothetical protein